MLDSLPSDGEPPDRRPPIVGSGEPADGEGTGEPIVVRLNEHGLGDLGNPRVDAALLLAIIRRNQRVADWLGSSGITESSVREAFPRADSLLDDR